MWCQSHEGVSLAPCTVSTSTKSQDSQAELLHVIVTELADKLAQFTASADRC